MVITIRMPGEPKFSKIDFHWQESQNSYDQQMKSQACLFSRSIAICYWMNGSWQMDSCLSPSPCCCVVIDHHLWTHLPILKSQHCLLLMLSIPDKIFHCDGFFLGSSIFIQNCCHHGLLLLLELNNALIPTTISSNQLLLLSQQNRICEIWLLLLLLLLI